jgi:hypothetical protein
MTSILSEAVNMIGRQAMTGGKFGIGGKSNAGVLMPKLKHRFKVEFSGFGGPTNGSLTNSPLILTQQVVTVGRPSVQFQNTALHSYNSIVYYANKPEWQTIEITLRDDINSSLTSIVSTQNNIQMNFFTQGAAAAAANYKFSTYIEMLDGSSAQTPIETWALYGCFLDQVQYDSLDYASSEPVIITLTLRYDVALQGSEITTLERTALTQASF